MVLLTLTPALMGARCSPSRRPRSSSQNCTQPGPYAANCALDAVPASATSTLGQLPACLNACRPQPMNLSVTDGAICVINPCDSGLFTAGRVMCPENWNCAPTGGGLGVCRRGESEVFGLCEVTSLNPCPTGTYCRPFTTDFPRPSGDRFALPRGTGMCVPPVREGGKCESDFGATGVAAGRQCEPGLRCDTMPGTTSGALRCQRPCTSDDECPCSTGTTTISCIGASSSSGVCNFCFADRTECDPSVGACCNANATCQEVSFAGNSEPQCCVEDGTSCSSTNECCNGSICRKEGVCGACTGANVATTDSRNCCPGLEYVGNICRVPCINRETNQVMEEGAACGTTPGCNSKVFCDPSLGYECRPPDDRSANDATCDGNDDDCDERIDEDAMVPCRWFPPGCQPPSGSWNGLPGERPCNDPQAACRPIDSDAYCSVSPTGFSRGPRSCWTRFSGVNCATSGCNARERCGPGVGFACISGFPGGNVGNPCAVSGNPRGCDPGTGGTCVQSCVPLASATTQCWLP